jgi:molecular chaperone GrpE
MALFKKKETKPLSENGSDVGNNDFVESNADNTVQQAENDLQACQQELASLKDRFVRSNADFENYKRRQEKERLLWADAVQIAVLGDMLTAVDDVERANLQLQKQERTPELEAWLVGIDLISKSLAKVLAKYGVQEMSSYVDFDPELHEALAQVDSSSHTSGQIVEVLQKGFMYKDQVLRHAKVSVAK